MAKDSYPSRNSVPRRATLAHLRQAAAACKTCDLYKIGTQTVFGNGPSKAAIMFIGEMAGDQEDREGKPFVGPAGKLFDRLLGFEQSRSSTGPLGGTGKCSRDGSATALAYLLDTNVSEAAPSSLVMPPSD